MRIKDENPESLLEINSSQRLLKDAAGCDFNGKLHKLLRDKMIISSLKWNFSIKQ